MLTRPALVLSRRTAVLYSRSMRILVIEDEKKTAAFLAKGLREAGFVVEIARDGETGLQLARASRHVPSSATNDRNLSDCARPHRFARSIAKRLIGRK